MEKRERAKVVTWNLDEPNNDQIDTGSSEVKRSDVGRMDPKTFRALARAAEWARPTAGVATGFAQANLAILPESLAFDFLVFCQRNPKSCPLLEVLDPGSHVPEVTAPSADIRTDLPTYRIYRGGELVDEVAEITGYWAKDAVTFIIGCSFTFEQALVESGIPVRHIEAGCNAPMYRTSRKTRPSGSFHGREVVSMRPIPADMVSRAVQITSRFPLTHGAPIHIGSPRTLGIVNLHKPDYGDPVQIRDGEVPVFWACGVTPQSVALESRPSWMITHSPGHMFVTDLKNEDLLYPGGRLV